MELDRHADTRTDTGYRRSPRWSPSRRSRSPLEEDARGAAFTEQRAHGRQGHNRAADDQDCARAPRSGQPALEPRPASTSPDAGRQERPRDRRRESPPLRRDDDDRGESSGGRRYHDRRRHRHHHHHDDDHRGESTGRRYDDDDHRRHHHHDDHRGESTRRGYDDDGHHHHRRHALRQCDVYPDVPRPARGARGHPSRWDGGGGRLQHEERDRAQSRRGGAYGSRVWRDEDCYDEPRCSPRRRAGGDAQQKRRDGREEPSWWDGRRGEQHVPVEERNSWREARRGKGASDHAPGDARARRRRSPSPLWARSPTPPRYLEDRLRALDRGSRSGRKRGRRDSERDAPLYGTESELPPEGQGGRKARRTSNDSQDKGGGEDRQGRDRGSSGLESSENLGKERAPRQRSHVQPNNSPKGHGAGVDRDSERPDPTFAGSGLIVKGDGTKSTSAEALERQEAERKETANDESEDDDLPELIGPTLPAAVTGSGPGSKGVDYGKALRPGEADAMAAFIQEGKRIPRRGEIGLQSDQIANFEAQGYVMSGSRNMRMEAVRIRKENQVYSAEELAALSQFSHAERQAREARLLTEFRTLVAQKVSDSGAPPPTGERLIGPKPPSQGPP